MNERNIQQADTARQDAMEGIFTMEGISRTRLIHSLITEYGQYDDGSYAVNVREFSLSDKRRILYYFAETSDEFEEAHESPVKTEAIFLEHEKYIQRAIDEECFDVYREHMEEMGMVLNHYRDNNEIYWTRR